MLMYRGLRHSTRDRAPRHQRVAARCRRPAAEILEDRALLSILVSTFEDSLDDSDGRISLREAISMAADEPGADVITLPQTVNGLQGTYDIHLGALVIADPDPLSLVAQGGAVTLNAQGTSQVISVGFESAVTLEGLVITGGYAFEGGGGISNQGALTVRDCTIAGNAAAYSGGGIYNGMSGTLELERVQIQDNVCLYGPGGGLFNEYGAVQMNDCSVMGNTAILDGGGVGSFLGSIRVTGSTITGNTAERAAGLSIADYSGAIVTGNQITANHGIGLLLGGYSAMVQGNLIADNDGDGVCIDQGSYATIGTPELGNTIRDNRGAGVSVLGDYAAGNTIRGNAIHGNAGLAIDLGGDGRTGNDPADTDFGPNTQQNFPVLSGFTTGATTRVVGAIESTPWTTFTVDLYAASAAATINPGQSTRYLGFVNVTTDASGAAPFDVTLLAGTTAAEVVTATATAPSGDTSEFSELNLIWISPTSGLATSESGAQAEFVVVLAAQPAANVIIPLSSSNRNEGILSASSLTFTPLNWSTPQRVVITGVDDAIADGPVLFAIVTDPAISGDPLFNGLNAGDVSATNMDNDFTTPAAIQPAGSLIFGGTLEGVVSSGSTQMYALDIDPGQTITVEVIPEGTDLRPTVRLYQAGRNRAIASDTAETAGRTAVLPTVDLGGSLSGDHADTETYQIRVTGASGTTGRYHIRILLNAAVEEEERDGDRNDEASYAQDLDPSFISLSSVGMHLGSADRGAVLGTTDATTPDYYAFSLERGDSVSLAVTGLSSGDLSLNLENARGAVLATGAGGSTNLGQVIDGFVATRKGTYYARVFGSNPDGTDYSLVITHNVTLDREANDSLDAAQDLDSAEAGDRLWVLGAIEAGGTYTATAQSSTFLDISLTGQAVLQGADDEAVMLGPSDLNGFQFTLYGHTSESLNISANGYVYQPGDLGGVVYALYQDLVVQGEPDSAVFWQVIDNGGVSQLIVQWNNLRFYGMATDPITFQAVLSENGSVQFNYRDLHTSLFYLDEGQNAVVGISGYPDGVYTALLLPTSDAPNALVGTGRSTLIAQPQTADFYRITVEENTTLRIETMVPAAGAGAFDNSLDPIIRLYDSEGHLVAWDDNGNRDGLNAMLQYRVPAGQGGVYTIEIAASPATAAPTQGTYILSVKAGEGGCRRHLEQAIDQAIAEGALCGSEDGVLDFRSWSTLVNTRGKRRN